MGGQIALLIGLAWVVNTFQKSPGAKDAHDAWLSWSVKTCQTLLGANGADDAWLAWFLETWQDLDHMMLMLRGWLGRLGDW